MGAADARQRDVFVDESKVRDYLLVAVSLERAHVRAARTAMAALILRGQSRLHMRKESDPRRRSILSTIETFDTVITVVRAQKDGRTDLVRRDACLRRLVAMVMVDGDASVCLERDETLVRKDRQTIMEATHRSKPTHHIPHRHESAAQEPLLALPDAVGWAWAKGGDWRRRCGGGITVIDV